MTNSTDADQLASETRLYEQYVTYWILLKDQITNVNEHQHLKYS